jgi:hypothetical protein
MPQECEVDFQVGEAIEDTFCPLHPNYENKITENVTK